MEWMYNANKKGVNPEEYLLGKKIDSAAVDAQKEEEQEGSSGAVAIDMANKIREDPLFAIKQKEASKRKALLENPIRLKQLQQMLQSQVGERSKKSKKKEKKQRKEKKQKKSRRHRQQSSESSGEESGGDDLDAQLMEKLRGKDIGEDEVKAVLKGKQYGLIGGRSDTRTDDDQRHKERNSKKRHEEEEEGDRRDRDRHHDRRKREERRNRDDDGRDRRDERHHRSRSPPARQERKKASKMSEEELERKRKEMMDNAKWRDDQRKKRVDQYRDEAAKEDEMEKTKKSRKQDFFNPLKVTSHSSVEDRIKRNIHNIQRTKADLDKNFAKR